LENENKFSENLPYAVLTELWGLCGLHGYSVASLKIYFIVPYCGCKFGSPDGK